MFIRLMQLQLRLSSLSAEEWDELHELLEKLKCECERDAECRGVCAVERRVNRFKNEVKQ